MYVPPPSALGYRADVEQANHTRVLDAAQDGGLMTQPRLELGRRTPASRQHLQRDHHAGRLVDCAVHHGHPTRTKLGNDAIGSETQPTVPEPALRSAPAQ